MIKDDLELLRNSLSKVKDGKNVLVDPPTYAVAMLEDICNRTGLDWKLRHCYLMDRAGKWRVELSIDGFRAVANTDDSYNGQAGPFWTLGPDQPWSDIPPDKAPYASKVGVYRKGQSEPTWGVAKYKDYAAGAMWTKFPSTMIAKCAEMLALRKALPGKLGGLYGAEEMSQADGGRPKLPEKAPDFATPAVPRFEGHGGPEHDENGVVADDLSTFSAKISNAASKQELAAIGLEIQGSKLGVPVKLQLSKTYQDKKQSEGWA